MSPASVQRPMGADCNLSAAKRGVNGRAQAELGAMNRLEAIYWSATNVVVHVFRSCHEKESIMAQSTAKSAPARPLAAGSAVKRPSVVSRDTIAALAHQKWQRRGCPAGDDQRDWFEAEKELNAGARSQN